VYSPHHDSPPSRRALETRLEMKMTSADLVKSPQPPQTPCRISALSLRNACPLKFGVVLCTPKPATKWNRTRWTQFTSS